MGKRLIVCWAVVAWACFAGSAASGASANDTPAQATNVNSSGLVDEVITSLHDLAWFRFALGQRPAAGGSGTIGVSVAQTGCEIDARIFVPDVLIDYGGKQASPGHDVTLDIVASEASEWLLRVVPTAATANVCAGATVHLRFGTTPGELFVPVGSLPAPPAPPIPGGRGRATSRGPGGLTPIAHLTRTGPRGRVVLLTLEKRVGSSRTRKYAVALKRHGKTIAAGTVRGRLLRLAIGASSSAPLELRGGYRLVPAKGARGVARIAPLAINVSP